MFSFDLYCDARKHKIKALWLTVYQRKISTCIGLSLCNISRDFAADSFVQDRLTGYAQMIRVNILLQSADVCWNMQATSSDWASNEINA